METYRRKGRIEMQQQDEKAYIFGALFILANRLQYLGDQFDEQITLKQWGVLATLSTFEGDSASLGQVAAFMGSSGQNVKKMAAILERKGFLTMQVDEKDSRSIRLTATPEALAHAKSRETREEEFLEKLYQGMDEELLKTMCRGLGKLEENMKELEEEVRRNNKG